MTLKVEINHIPIKNQLTNTLIEFRMKPWIMPIIENEISRIAIDLIFTTV
jgi:hypothetical protein